MRRPQEFQPLDSAVIPRFAEPATFMRTRYVPSYAGLDIALVGVPFDLGSTNRAGGPPWPGPDPGDVALDPASQRLERHCAL